MSYTYEACIEEQEGGWLVTFPDLEGCIGDGDTIESACQSASVSLQLYLAGYIDEGIQPPAATFRGAPYAVFTVDVTQEFVERTKCLTISEAALVLDVSAPKVCQLISAGKLTTIQSGGEQLVTIASVNAYKATQERREG